MAQARHYIANNEIGPPENWPEFRLKADFTNGQREAELNVSSVEFIGEPAFYLYDRAFNGTTGGLGIFQADPYRIEFGPQGAPLYTWNGYLDFSDGNEFIQCERVVSSLKKRKGSDWLNDVADGFSFAYLASLPAGSPGKINDSDYTRVPYVINFIPDNLHLAMLALSLYMMTKELIENIREISNQIAELINAATPNAGAGVTIDLGDIIWAALKIIARIAYAVVMAIAIFNLVKEIIAQLVPRRREHLAMKLDVMMRKACEYINMQFESTLLTQTLKDWTFIPTKSEKGLLPNAAVGSQSGVPQKDDGIYHFGDAIRVFMDMFNADWKIEQNGNGQDVFRFERRDYWQGQSTYVVPGVFNEQDLRANRVGANTDEIVKNYNINWAFDTQDQNTVEDRTGLVYQTIIEPITVGDPDLVTLKGLSQVNIPFSMGKRKEELTIIEKVLKALGSFVDALTGIFGNGTNFASQIEARIGSLLLSSHQLTKGKIVKMNGNKLAQNQRVVCSAQFLWDNLHYINSGVEINGIHNQWITIPNVTVPMCLEDFVSLLGNNYAETEDGRRVELEIVDFDPEQEEAVISFRINHKYDANLRLESVA